MGWIILGGDQPLLRTAGSGSKLGAPLKKACLACDGRGFIIGPALKVPPLEAADLEGKRLADTLQGCMGIREPLWVVGGWVWVWRPKFRGGQDLCESLDIASPPGPERWGGSTPHPPQHPEKKSFRVEGAEWKI